MEKEGCCFAGIFSLDGNPWAQSKNGALQCQAAQIAQVAAGLKNPNTVDLRATGVKFGDVKFIFVMQADNLVVLKQLTGGDPSNKIMACVGLCKTCVIVCGSVAPNEKASRGSVEKYTDYLRGLNM